ncbi:MAG: hypothetical protein ACREQV_11590 [Candidatus Binatia bacterium]
MRPAALADNTEIRDSESVQKWLAGLEKHYGPSTEEEDNRRLQSLQRFCEFEASTPDEVVKRCFYRKKDSGDLRISVKARRHFAERIAEFQETIEGSRFDKAREGNAVRSFLIHNGMLFQSGVQH